MLAKFGALGFAVLVLAGCAGDAGTARQATEVPPAGEMLFHVPLGNGWVDVPSPEVPRAGDAEVADALARLRWWQPLLRNTSAGSPAPHKWIVKELRQTNPIPGHNLLSVMIAPRTYAPNVVNYFDRVRGGACSAVIFANPLSPDVRTVDGALSAVQSFVCRSAENRIEHHYIRVLGGTEYTCLVHLVWLSTIPGPPPGSVELGVLRRILAADDFLRKDREMDGFIRWFNVCDYRQTPQRCEGLARQRQMTGIRPI
jgi:hypothetical protein